MAEKHGDNVTYYHVDVLDPESIKSYANRIEKDFNSVTHLVSLAGWAYPDEFKGLDNLDTETIHKSIQLNLTSHLDIIRE